MSRENNFTLDQLKTIPNMLSVSRLLLIPALAIPSFLMADESQARNVFLIMFILIGVTDKLDGTIARYLNQTSHLGAKLDTMADMVFYPLITIWLYRFAPQVVDGWWTLVYLLAALYFAKMILGKIKFGEIYNLIFDNYHLIERTKINSLEELKSNRLEINNFIEGR